MRIINLPIEPLEERYTEQWNRWSRSDFESRLGASNVITIYGEKLTDKIECGKVLDSNSTIYWKSIQIQKIAQMFKNKEVLDGDIFFLHDLQFPGWEAIKYMAHLNNIKIKVFGFLHASSWTRGDFTEPMAPFLRPMEFSWINAADGIFVGSIYHKNKILSTIDPEYPDRESRFAQKIHATGNPLKRSEYESRAAAYGDTTKIKDRVIWPHRFHYEKDPFFAVDVVSCFPEEKEVEFVFINPPKSVDMKLNLALDRLNFEPTVKWVTIESKDHYYNELAKSTVIWSTSPEESFGYCFAEGISLGCHPILPACASHIEIVQAKERYLYVPGDIVGCIEKIIDALDKPSPPMIYLESYERAFIDMLDIMRRD